MTCVINPPIPLRLSNIRLHIDEPSDDPGLCAILTKVQLDMSSAHALNIETVGQSESPKWREERRVRLTASNFGAIIKRKMAPSESFMRSIFNPVDISKVSSVSYGRNREGIAKEKYIKKMEKNKKHVITLFDTGLCVNPSFPHLGATPDGRVLDRSVATPLGILEIKCPCKFRDFLPEDASSHRDFCLQMVNNKLMLKENHPYYYQVQGQMAIAQVEWCDFAVYTTKGIHVQRISYNNDVWQDMFCKLNDFYFKHGVPFLKASLQN